MRNIIKKGHCWQMWPIPSNGSLGWVYYAAVMLTWSRQEKFFHISLKPILNKNLNQGNGSYFWPYYYFKHNKL